MDINDFQLNNIVEEARNIVHYDAGEDSSARAHTNSNTHSYGQHSRLYSKDGDGLTQISALNSEMEN